MFEQCLNLNIEKDDFVLVKIVIELPDKNFEVKFYNVFKGQASSS